jgi:hypothetical protein
VIGRLKPLSLKTSLLLARSGSRATPPRFTVGYRRASPPGWQKGVREGIARLGHGANGGWRSGSRIDRSWPAGAQAGHRRDRGSRGQRAAGRDSTPSICRAPTPPTSTCSSRGRNTRSGDSDRSTKPRASPTKTTRGGSSTSAPGGAATSAGSSGRGMIKPASPGRNAG